jgi:hypothetical protein
MEGTLAADGGLAGARGRTTGPAEVDFRRLLGPAAWAGLPPAVQARFLPHVTGVTCRFEGVMCVAASPAGWMFAQVCRLIGTPLAPWTGEAVPTQVDVRLDPEGALVWDRTYRFPGRAPVLVSSRKIANARGDLLEVVRGGLGMALAVTAEHGAVHFRSTRYFLTIGPWRLPVPGLITPGRAHVIHRDEGGGRFRFTLEFRHPLLGRTLFQEGVFADPKPPWEGAQS